MLHRVSLIGASLVLLSAVVLACTSSSTVSPPDTSGSGDHDASVEAGGDVADEAGSCLKRKEGPSRTAAAACAPRTRESWDGVDAGAKGDGGDECTSDAECNAGTNGRCGPKDGTNGERVWTCTYDACSSDDGCTDGAVCECELGYAKQHVCLSNGNCRVDSDCPSGERCMLSVPDLLTLPAMSGRSIEKGDEVVPPHLRSSRHEALGYFCTTPNDTCNEDCAGGIVRCTYDINEKRWAWGYQF